LKHALKRILKQREDTDTCSHLNPISGKPIDICSQLQKQILAAQASVASCKAGLHPPGRYSTTGFVTLLRVHETAGFGPADDHLEGEVVFQVDSEPLKSFGFFLRPGDHTPAQDGMLSLLRDAFLNDLPVTFDYDQEFNKHNSPALRITLSRSA
jgi:hypothetical protein